MKIVIASATKRLSPKTAALKRRMVVAGHDVAIETPNRTRGEVSTFCWLNESGTIPPEAIERLR